MDLYFQQAWSSYGAQLAVYANVVMLVLFALAFVLACAQLGRTAHPPKHSEEKNAKNDGEEL